MSALCFVSMHALRGGAWDVKGAAAAAAAGDQEIRRADPSFCSKKIVTHGSNCSHIVDFGGGATREIGDKVFLELLVARGRSVGHVCDGSKESLVSLVSGRNKECGKCSMHVQRGNGFDDSEHCFCPVQRKEQAVRCCSFGDVVFTGNCNVNLSSTFCLCPLHRQGKRRDELWPNGAATAWCRWSKLLPVSTYPKCPRRDTYLYHLTDYVKISRRRAEPMNGSFRSTVWVLVRCLRRHGEEGRGIRHT